MLQKEIVHRVYELISVITELDGTDIHEGVKPSSDNSESYICINCLAVPGGRLSSTYVNVNCYAKDIAPGEADVDLLDQMAQPILTALKEVNMDGFFVDFDHRCKTEQIPEPDKNLHYLNIKFSVAIIN